MQWPVMGVQWHFEDEVPGGASQLGRRRVFGSILAKDLTLWYPNGVFAFWDLHPNCAHGVSCLWSGLNRAQSLA